MLRRRRLAVTGLGVFALAVLIIVIASLSSGGSSEPAIPAATSAATPTTTTPARTQTTTAAPRSPTPQLVVKQIGHLSRPLQNAAATGLGSTDALVLGGVDASGSAVVSIAHVNGSNAEIAGQLPSPVHDGTAVTLGGSAYLFGGADATSTSTILRVESSGVTQQVGRLPSPSADAASTAIGDTAYVVGGYTGARVLDTIVAWKPQDSAHVVGHLPVQLRYPVVGAVSGQLVIAGGTTAAGAAGSGVYSFDPTSGTVKQVAELPQPLTHSAAAVLNGIVYLLGGRHTAAGSATSDILAFDPATSTVSTAGSLPSPLSDASAVGLADQILLAGGRDDSGQVHDQIYSASVR